MCVDWLHCGVDFVKGDKNCRVFVGSDEAVMQLRNKAMRNVDALWFGGA